jgi:hypothetical protein
MTNDFEKCRSPFQTPTSAKPQRQIEPDGVVPVVVELGDDLMIAA